MPDFTSALYLGLRHPSDALAPWPRLTTGAPAAMGEPPAAGRVAARVAARQGTERALVAASTLHLAWDLLGWLARRPLACYLDAAAYPILGWGVERARGRGALVRRFPAHDADTLRRLVAGDRAGGRLPVVVADGWCPACGRASPLGEYLAVARAAGGLLVVDDTQALGILGAAPSAARPLGHGGGGTMRWLGIAGPELVVVASLAKGLGAPLATLGGAAETIAAFAAASETRVHCSAPSAAALHAAAHALDVDDATGERRRERLTALVRRLREAAHARGLALAGGPFPAQSVPVPRERAGALRDALARRGVAVVATTRHAAPGAALTLLLTARHTVADVEAGVDALATTLATGRPASRRDASHWGSPCPCPSRSRRSAAVRSRT